MAARTKTPTPTANAITRHGPAAGGSPSATRTAVSPTHITSEIGGTARSPSWRQARWASATRTIARATGTPPTTTARRLTTAPATIAAYATPTRGWATAIGANGAPSVIRWNARPATTNTTQLANTTSSEMRRRSIISG